MKLIRVYITAALMLGYSASVVAQTEPAPQASNMLTLEQAIDLALKNNFDIRLAKTSAELAANDWQYANLALAPRVNGTATRLWTNSHSKQEFANGSKNEVDGIKNTNTTASVNLQWTLFDGLKMFATREKAQALRDAGELAVKDRMVNTVAAVINSYYNVVQLKQQLRAITEQMSISEERVKLSDAKFQTGLGPKTDLLQAKVDLNAQKQVRLRQLTLINQGKTNLNQLLAVNEASISYDVLDTIPVNMNLPYGELKENFLKTNTLVKGLEKNIEISQLGVKERKGEFYPTISFNSAYNFNTAKSNQAVNQFSSIFNRNNGFNYGFTASVPIFNALNAHRNLKAAKLDVLTQQLTLDDQIVKLNTQFNNAYNDYTYFKDAFELEEENILLAKENVMVALERFRQGVSTTLELKEAQQSLEDAYTRLILARYNTKVAETELLRLRGDIIK
ncbi:outer membrane protein TolC [Chitinophaga skermanii]|uniref:Outer membrane protein TolC n=1 Tax=Chitinophaga skermanii TaxID=331697 RepID=A0A327QHJ8_9BACT|nr:TolC family protein [Chitinophaga skermanii]RAJ04019.1 outer membrane protein TolC [Chitinophaga skermanii]